MTNFLPNDIWCIIAETLADRRTFKSLRCVSRQLCLFFTPMVFERVSVAVEQQSLERLVNIAHRPEIAPHVRTLALHLRELPYRGFIEEWSRGLCFMGKRNHGMTNDELLYLYKQYEEARIAQSSLLESLTQENANPTPLLDSLKRAARMLENLRQFSVAEHESSLTWQKLGIWYSAESSAAWDTAKQTCLMLRLLGGSTPNPHTLEVMHLMTTNRAFWSPEALGSMFETLDENFISRMRNMISLPFESLRELKLHAQADSTFNEPEVSTPYQTVLENVDFFLLRCTKLEILDLVITPTTWECEEEDLEYVPVDLLSRIQERQWPLRTLSLTVPTTEETLVCFLSRNSSNLRHLVLDKILLMRNEDTWPSVFHKLRNLLPQGTVVELSQLGRFGQPHTIILNENEALLDEVFRSPGREAKRRGFYLDAYTHYENEVLEYVTGRSDNLPEPWEISMYFDSHPVDCNWCLYEAAKLPTRKRLGGRFSEWNI